MGPHIDPLAVVRLLRPGQATAWVERAAGDGPTPVIGVREESRRIRRLPPDAPVELRAGVYTSPEAIVIPLLLRIGPERSDAVYEIWVNAHSTDFGLFDALAHDEEDDSLRLQDRWRDEQILEMLRAGWPSVKRARRKQSDESPREKVLLFAGQKIDWHLGLPELKVWSGQASLESIIDARVQAIRSHRLPEDATLIDWRVPMGTASGLDARSAVNAIDVGFSPTALGMDVFTFAAAELLGIVGMAVWPIIRFGYREYGYLDENDDLWRFGKVDRDGGGDGGSTLTRCQGQP